jgi:type VI protein secretion system component Hcp
MAIAIPHRARATLPAAVAAAVVLGLMLAHPAGSAIPAGSVVGKITYADISGTTDLTTNIRSFTLTAQVESGASRVSFELPKVVHEAISGSPDLLAATSQGRHLPTVSVTLYRPQTTTRFQGWTFTDAIIVLDKQTQNGPSAATPSETVSWSFRKVRQSTYQSDGTTVVKTFCFDLVLNAAC